MACRAFSKTLVMARASSVRSTLIIGLSSAVSSIAIRPARPTRYGSIDLFDEIGHPRRRRARRRRRRKAGELGGDLPQQPDLGQNRGDALVEHGRERPPPIQIHTLRVLGGQLDRRQRVLDVVRDLARHVGPGLEALGPFELDPLPLEILGHPVEVPDQPSQLVGCGGGHPRVQIAARDQLGGARQPVDRIGDPLRHPIAERRTEQAEQHRQRQHLPIEIVDLPFDFRLAQR